MHSQISAQKFINPLEGNVLYLLPAFRTLNSVCMCVCVQMRVYVYLGSVTHNVFFNHVEGVWYICKFFFITPS